MDDFWSFGLPTPDSVLDKSHLSSAVRQGVKGTVGAKYAAHSSAKMSWTHG